jgi:beta-galactosidase
MPIRPAVRLLATASLLLAAACQPAASSSREGLAGAADRSLPRSPAARVPLHSVTSTPLMLGVAWYPEQFPESAWEKDLRLMHDAGVTMVRLGEFAWSTLEPAEGQYQLDWLDRAVTLAGKYGMKVVLCTPTDAPPAWLTQKYPDTLRVDETGKQLRHGGRRQFSYTSPRFKDLARRVVEEMATRFGGNPHVIGWQVGNELTDDSQDDYSKTLFQAWLQDRYKSLDAVNAAWGTTYWSQTYSAWDQIPFPGRTDNPSLRLDYMRFVTQMWRDFVRDQHAALRRHIPPVQFVTTNLGGLGWANRFDRFQLSSDLDMITWDTYVGQGHLDAPRIGATHDLVRGWKGANFWVMETQPGSVNWAGINNILDRGETRELAWQAVGHGADCVAYWQWRSAPGGQEQYHGCIVGPDGNPLPIYDEVRQIGQEFAKARAALADTHVHSDVALLHDYDSRWAVEFQPHHNRYDVVNVLLSYYRPLRDLTQSVDIVSPYADLSGYKVIVAPSLNVLTPELAHKLTAWVQNGGHLVLGPRSGMKTESNLLDPRRQPGPLSDLLGGRVEQYYALLDEVGTAGAFGNGRAAIWAEHLSTAAPDTEVLLTYGTRGNGGWLANHAGAITRAGSSVGKGRITYIGALLDDDSTYNACKWALEKASLKPALLDVPAGIEVCRRTGKNGDVFILLNHGSRNVKIPLPAPMHDLLKDGQTQEADLDARGVAVLQAGRS